MRKEPDYDFISKNGTEIEKLEAFRYWCHCYKERQYEEIHSFQCVGDLITKDKEEGGRHGTKTGRSSCVYPKNYLVIGYFGDTPILDDCSKNWDE